MPDTKKLLQFYFRADKLDTALDNLILKIGLSSMDVGKTTEYCTDKIGNVIYDKQVLAELWSYLDEVIGGLENSDRAALQFYGLARSHLVSINDLEIKRSTMKFTRHLRSLEQYAEHCKVLDRYFGMIA